MVVAAGAGKASVPLTVGFVHLRAGFDLVLESLEIERWSTVYEPGSAWLVTRGPTSCGTLRNTRQSRHKVVAQIESVCPVIGCLEI